MVIAHALVQIDGFPPRKNHRRQHAALVAHKVFAVFVFVGHLQTSVEHGHGLHVQHHALFKGNWKDVHGRHVALGFGRFPLLCCTADQAHAKECDQQALEAGEIHKLTMTGVWSLGRSFFRGVLSITQAVTWGFRASDTKMWSMRKPRLRLKANSR